jgi:hypothetical protein
LAGVLQEDGHAGERPRRAGRHPLAGAVRQRDDHGPQVRVEPLDAGQRLLDQVARPHLTPTDELGGGHRAALPELGHAAPRPAPRHNRPISAD